MRRAKALPLARQNVSRLLADLKHDPVGKWRLHLKIAHELLAERKSISSEAAVCLIINSVSAAQECAVKINNRSLDISAYRACVKFRDSLERIANCAKRSSAELRRQLDAAVLPLVREGPGDLEVMGAIFDGAAGVFKRFPEHEPAQAALAIMCDLEAADDDAFVMKNMYESLGNLDRRRIEKALDAISKRDFEKYMSAARVFKTLASTLEDDPATKSSNSIRTLLVEYCVEIGKLWLAAGLRPSRTRREGDPAYKVLSIGSQISFSLKWSNQTRSAIERIRMRS